MRPALLGFCLLAALATGLTGCASKNPLIDEPAGNTAKRNDAASKESTTAASDEEGVQTVKQRRLFGILSPYRVDIQQGNFVSREMLTQLKEGMTADQVRFVLGTPLLHDILHADRWDYVFRLQKDNGEITTSRVSVYFKDGRVARFTGGNLPTEEEYLARIAGKVRNQNLQPAKPAAPASAVPEEAKSSQ